MIQTMKPVLLGLVAALAVLSVSAAPQVKNRLPQPDEVGYRPADGARVRLNPPSWIWLHEPDAHTYAIQWAPQKDFSDAQSASGFVWNTYTHHTPLAAGTWFWRYRFTNKQGETSNWSAVRSTVVPTEATAFPIPTRAQQKERVPKDHPRLFMRPEDLPRLRELAKGRESARFAKLRVEADRVIQAGPTPEPEHMGSARDKEDAEAVKYWWPNRQQAEKACLEAETIAFVYLITGEAKYGEAARKWLLHLASWSPDGPTNFKLNCEAGKVMLYHPARAYDWAYAALTPEDRATVQKVMLRRIQDAWESGEVARGTGHLNRPFNSHGNRVWHKIAESAITFLGDIPEADTWLDYAVNKFYSCYPIWSDDDGGWHEGVSYWNGYMGKAVTWLQVAQSALGIDGLKKPFFAQVGDYPLYITPPGSPNSGFGDLSFNPPSKGIGGWMDYHIRGGKNAAAPSGHAPYWRWWTETWGMKGEGGIFGFLYAANLSASPVAKAPTDLPPSKIFHGIGVASLHTTLLDAKDDVHFLFKSSPFGSQSHGHNPQNIFQLNAYGDALLTTCGYRDLHGSKFHYNWVHSTVAHNGVLVNGEGQVKHTASLQGLIVAEKLTPEWDYICGDATETYGGRLTRCRRHIAFVKGDAPFIVLYDELAAKEPSTFQFMLHALKEFTVDDKAALLSVERTNASVTVKYLSPEPLTFRQWDGFNPPPKKEFPNQWHVEAGTLEKRKEVAMLTVIVPHRAGKGAAWQAERVEAAPSLGARVTLGGKTTVVTFPKSTGAPPTVTVEK